MKSNQKFIILLFCIVIILVLGGCSGVFVNLPGGSNSRVLESKIPRETISQIPAEGLGSLTSGNNAFALDLYQRLQGSIRQHFLLSLQHLLSSGDDICWSGGRYRR